MTNNHALRALLLATVCSASLIASSARAFDVVIASGTTNPNNVLLGGTDTLTVQTGATTTNSTTSAAAVTQFANATGNGIVITNNGTIANTRTGAGPLITYGATTYLLDSYSTIWGLGNTVYTGNIAINNAGAISSAGGPAAFFAPQATSTTFINSGTLTAGGGYRVNGTPVDSGQKIAIAFGSGTNIFTNTATGVVTGNIVLGSGTNTVNLVAGNVAERIDGSASSSNTINLTGTGTGFGLAFGRSEGTSFRGWDNIQTLNVNSGTWVLTGGGYYRNLNIASGASFRVCDIRANGCGNISHGVTTDGGIGPLGGGALNVTLDGLMVLESADGRIYYDPTSPESFRATGTGRLLIQNTAGTGGYVGPASNLSGFAGTTIVDGGAFILGTTIGGNVVINPRGTLSIGSGGNLRNINGQIVDNGLVGNVLGNIVDNGTLVFNRLDDFTYAGNLSGNGNIIKAKSNTVTLSGTYTYTGRTQILGGAIVLAPTAKLSAVSALDVSAGSISLNGTSQDVAGLSSTDGSAGTINVGGGALKVTQSDNSSFGGTLTGAGALTKAGSGSLILSGNNSGFSGTTSITGGLLEVGDASNPGATLGGSISVAAGGILGGHGTITGSVTNAGVLAPGGSIGTLSVAGNYGFASGSILEQEVAANGDTDLTRANGAITIAANVTALVQPTDPVASYAPLTRYTIITAGNGVSGTFAATTSSVAGLTPVLDYSSNAVTLTLVRNDFSLAPLAATPNQASVANALSSGAGGALFGRVAVNGAGSAQQALNALSGEVHATAASVIMENGGFIADAIASRPVSDKGLRIWGQENNRWTDFSAGSNTAAAHNSFLGFAGGADMAVNLFSQQIRLGLVGGYSHDNIAVDARSSSGRIDTTHLGGYAELVEGSLSLTTGISYSWHNIGVSRFVVFPVVNQSLASSYNGRSLGVFADLHYRFETGSIWIEPMTRLTWSQLETDAFSEAGGSAALNAATRTRNAGFAIFGADVGKSFLVGGGILTPHAMLGWERGFGNLATTAQFGASGVGSAFAVLGAPLSRDAFRTEAGFTLALGDIIGLNVGYVGRHSGTVTQNGFQASIKADF